MNRYASAKADLKRVGTANAKGDALAACYAPIVAAFACVSAESAFACLVHMTDGDKLAAVKRWQANPMAIFDDLWTN